MEAAVLWFNLLGSLHLEIAVVDDARGPFDGHDAEQLRAGLTDAVARVFADAAGDRPGGPRPPSGVPDDALDELIARADRHHTEGRPR